MRILHPAAQQSFTSKGETPNHRRKRIYATVVNRISRHLILSEYQDCVHVDVNGNTVRLSGELPNYFLIRLLQTTVKYLPGINHVVNNVTIPSVGM